MSGGELEERLLRGDDYDNDAASSLATMDSVRLRFDSAVIGNLQSSSVDDDASMAKNSSGAAVSSLVSPPSLRVRRLRTRCGICAPFIMLLFIAGALVIAGALLFFPASIPLASCFGFEPNSEALMMSAAALIALSAAAPILSLCCCVWVATPSKAAHARAAVFADALLEEVCGNAGSGAALADAYDIFDGTTNNTFNNTNTTYDNETDKKKSNYKDGGATVLMIAGGTGAPRVVLRGLARRVAAAGLRVLVVDLPGHGELAAVTFSLARSARVISAVLARDARACGSVNATAAAAAASSMSPSSSATVVQTTHGSASRAVLVAYGAAAYPAAHFSAANPTALAGLVLLGAPPPTTSWFALRARVLRLLWASDLTSLALRGRVAAHAFASEEEKAELAAATWTVGVIVDLLEDVKRARAPFPLLPALRAARAPLMVLGPPAWVARARRLIPLPSARFVVGAGVKDILLPTLVPEKQAVLAAALAKFARVAVLETAAAVDAAEAANASSTTSPQQQKSGSMRGGWVAARKSSSRGRTTTLAQQRFGGGGGGGSVGGGMGIVVGGVRGVSSSSAHLSRDEGSSFAASSSFGNQSGGGSFAGNAGGVAMRAAARSLSIDRRRSVVASSGSRTGTSVGASANSTDESPMQSNRNSSSRGGSRGTSPADALLANTLEAEDLMDNEAS